MGSLLRRSLYFTANNIVRGRQSTLTIVRLQQTNAALNSVNETHQVKNKELIY